MNQRVAFGRWCVVASFVFLTTTTTAIAQRPSPPGPPSPQTAPICPIYPIGFVNGAWYYVTSDCNGSTGYGMSPVYYADSQCDGTHCRNPVMIGGVADLSAEVAQSIVDECVTRVTEARDKMQRAVSAPKVSSDRKKRINVVLPYANEVLAYLKSNGPTNAEKQAACDEFFRSYGQHSAKWTYLGMAPGSTVKMAIKDGPVDPAELKPVAQTVFDLSKVDPAKVNVTPNRDKLLKITPRAGATPVYYQCFKVEVVRKMAPAGRDTLMLAIETTPTEAEKATAEVGEISEQGDYTHRIKDRSNRPFVAVGATSLSP